jgi:predicted flap endonuclease-1-like 5' DNA nuclease
MGQKVVVRDKKGVEKSISATAWDLMRSAKEQGDTRKGLTFVRFAKEGESKAVSAPSAVAKAMTFIPDEIAHKANAKAEGEMVSGTATQAAQEPETPPAAPEAPAKSETPAQSAAAAQAAPEKAPAAPVAEEPALAAAYDGPKDDLAAIDTIGKAAAEGLNSIGIYTYAQLAAANNGHIFNMLDRIKLTPKKAQVPGWKMKAKERAIATTHA